ncbi:MAG: hypothetical protein LBN39_02340 [Planctomycetaceae bacterium]|jgi:uncharacterized repeat protein (TIGR04138 family)|nr:hypothetical protein [Planctomycetaceae bacterium]
MSHPAFSELLARDRRYKKEAYIFVYETLGYAQDVMKLGKNGLDGEPGNQVSGQDLCRAARDYAVQQYGLLAKSVLNSMGIRKTNDIGAIVYNLIEARLMNKTDRDSIDDFSDVFDFDEAFNEEYKISH